jgi:ribonucleotide reductase alpha subunit/DNA-binding transcriptional regulator WhiA
MSRADEIGADEITLPIKRTDGETLEERMTANAYHNILPARYLRVDEDGNHIEEQEDLFERVARNIALAEAVYEADDRGNEITVTPAQLKPDHPRPDELAAEVFGAGTTADDDVETALTEANVNKFAHETIVPELPLAVRQHVETVKAEFQDLMEQLAFTPNCVPPDSLVAANGGLKPLSAVDPGERVYDDEDGYANVQEKYENGEKLVLEIETASGYSVRATPEHYFRVITEDGEYEWRQVKDIEAGHTVALQKNFLDDEGNPSQLEAGTTAADGGSLTSATTTNTGRPRSAFETPDAMTPDLAEWLGLYIGDGTARESGVRVAFGDVDEDLVQHWVALTESVFGFEPTTRTRTDASCIIGQAHRRDLYDFLERNDLLKETSETAMVPDAVLRSGRTCVASFLSGLFEADGTVNDRSIELYTHSKPLASQTQKLLLGLGISSKVTEKRDGYRVTIRKNVCGRRFVERVGFIGERKNVDATRFAEVSDNATSVKIPNQTERLHEWFQESDLGLDAYRDLSQFLIDSGSEYHQEIGKEIFSTYAEKYPELKESPVTEHVERDQIYEPVSTITEIGTMAVEDMQVPRRNTYVVEGFVSHNSPTLMNAGDELQQLSACFVDSPDDDIDDIHQTAKEAAQVFQCLTDDVRTYVDGKGVVSIADVEPGDRIRQRDGDSYRTRNVEETHAYDDAPVSRVVSEAGLELTGTPNHKLLVNGEWTRIDEIEPGDTLTVRLGWITDEDDTTELTTVAAGGQWADNRTVSNDEIVELYSEGLSDYAIAEQIGCSASTVQRRRANDLGLEPNGTGGRPRGSVSFDADELDRLYEDGRSDGEIAEELGVSQRTVCRYREHQSLEPNGEPAKSVTQPTTLTSDLAELVGMWVGDGSKHQDGIRFHLERDETLEHVDRLCRRLFDVGVDWRWDEGCYDAVVHSHEIKRWWLANFGDAKPDATTAKVPDCVLRADCETVGAFLRGLFSTDGSLQKDRYPRLWSASKTLVDEVQQLLLGIGIPAAQWELDSEERDYYNVGPTGELGLKTFAARVGFVDGRAETMTGTLEDAEFRGTTFGTVRDETTWELPVESVEDAGTATVYDVTVADNHEYVASSVVSHNSGGGMGYAFWRLRPYGDTVGSTGGIASGPITFMRTYDQMCETIAQGGTRRGAQMGVMKVSHPDVIQFIHAKNKDVSLAESLRLNDPDDYTHTSFKDALAEARELIDEDGRVPKHLRNAAEGHLSNFNISVGVSDDFMEALYNDEEFTFINPRTGEPHVATEYTEELYECFGLGEYVEVGEELSMPASILWERIIEGAHENGEPGVIYLERVNQEHSFDVEEHPDHEILATNPCLHGDMEVAVADGRKSVPIAELASEEGPVPVYTLTDDGELTILDAEAFKTKGDANLVKVETDGSTTLKLTPDHEVRTRNRGWIEAADLQPRDSLEILTKYDAPLGAVIGSDADADGTKYRWLNTGRRSNRAEHRAIAAYDGQEIDGKVIHHENHDSLDNRLENLTAMSKEVHDDLHDISGERNPLHILKERGEFEAFRERNSFYDVEGENNPMYGRSNRWAGVVEWKCTRDECSETLELAPVEAQNRKYCSRECADKARELHVEFECENCGETIVAHGSGANKRKYCTRACTAEDTLEGEAKEAFLRHLFVDNPMQREEVKERKVANTDYEAVGESISETRREKIKSDDLEVEMRDYGPVHACRVCGEQFGAVTNTHLNSAHDMSVDDYKEQYPSARLHSKQPVVTENHEVVSVTSIDSADVYDLSVPETHNFYAGLNIRENDDNRKDVFVNVHNCGEQPLEEYEACNLGHINLSTLAGMDAPDWRVWYDEHGDEYDDIESAIDAFLEEAIDFEEFDHRIEWGTRFLENVVTMSDFPIEEIETKVSEMRKIGLGVMGLAQLYIQLGVRYGSDAGNEIARQLMVHINHESKWTSHELAEVRDSFDEWDKSKYADPTEYREWFEHQTGLDADDWEDGFPIRNHNTTTIAPTGTTSMVGNTTGGCEPIYNVAYYKNVSDDVQGDEMLVEFDDYFLRTLEANGIDVEAVKDEAKEQMATNEFAGVEGLETVPDAIGELFVITSDLAGKQHAAVQCACQEGVDSAISKCIEEGTLVQTDQGLVPIEGFSDNDKSGTFSDVDGEYTIDGYEVTAHYYAGKKPSTRIRLDSGAELVGATESHRVMTPDGWKLLADLTEGDIVLGDFSVSHSEGGQPIEWDDDLQTSSNTIETPEQMSPEFAEFLGMIAADGGAYEETGRVEVTTDNMPVEDRYAELSDRLFGAQVKVDDDDRRENIRRVYLTSRNLARCVHSLLGSGAYEKRVPEQVIRGSAEEKLAFIRGLTLDGHNNSNGFTVYGGMSEELAYGTAQLLRSFGVPKVYEGRKWVSESEAYAHQVTVSNELQELVSAIESHKNPEPQFVRYKVPVDSSELSLADYETGTSTYYAVRSARNRGNQHLFNETAEKIGIKHSGIAYKVTEVEDVGERELYDIEVEESHQYLVNGIVSHNTCNFPNSATREDMDDVYRYIYDNGGKGVTVYRDGTRSKQVLTTRADNATFADEGEAAEGILEQIDEHFGGVEAFLSHEAVEERALTGVKDLIGTRPGQYAEKKDRPDQLHGVTQRIDTGYGKLYVTINEDPSTGEPFELFANTGHSGGFTNSFTDALAKTISIALRSGVDPYEIVDKLQGIRSPKVAWDKGEQINSIPDAFGTAMRRYLDDEIDRTYPQQQTLEESADEGEPEPTTAEPEDATQSLIDAGESPECPDCGSMALYFAEGCKTCESCGWSECS